jgi:hypothetical protein
MPNDRNGVDGVDGVDGVAHPVNSYPVENGVEETLLEIRASPLLPRSSSGEVWVLELKPITDPLTRRGLPSRPVAVRMRNALKELLRVHGLKAVVIRDPTPAETVRAGAKPLQASE